MTDMAPTEDAMKAYNGTADPEETALWIMKGMLRYSGAEPSVNMWNLMSARTEQNRARINEQNASPRAINAKEERCIDR